MGGLVDILYHCRPLDWSEIASSNLALSICEHLSYRYISWVICGRPICKKRSSIDYTLLFACFENIFFFNYLHWFRVEDGTDIFVDLIHETTAAEEHGRTGSHIFGLKASLSFYFCPLLFFSQETEKNQSGERNSSPLLSRFLLLLEILESTNLAAI